MTDLNNLLTEANRANVVADIARLVDNVVANQSGLTGMALKSAVAAGKKADADAIPKGVNRFLPQIVSELEPLFQDYLSAGAGSFGAFLGTRESDVVEKILAAADGATGEMPSAVQKVYSTLRGKAGKIISPALPELGDIIERYAK
ncbi:hypothetical protein [Corynebacterium sp. HMSC29G08]|uniref:DUF6918 family protein n=1 Tax=Corynebacterium sp. HMSC29G08 TaxID=1581069 RepID=UPI0008A212F9|nr:hypothetical protein [Corynebacterium sp. HMSC29G08]OFT84252.1 hypothetical protein HMPREF3101_04370 [Corynebacterium sp. HMSC29G08]